jgi:hypothetical protein
MTTALGPRGLGIVPGALRCDLDRSAAVLAAQPFPQRRLWRWLGEHKGGQVGGCGAAAVPRSGRPHGARWAGRHRAAAWWRPGIPARRPGIRR